VLYSSHSSQHLVSTLEPVGMLADAHAPQKGYIKFRINPAVEVSASRGDAAFPLQRS
jgi:hypothetical protein